MHWLLPILLLAACAPRPDVLTREEAALELAGACSEAAAWEASPADAELLELCDPAAVRGRSPEQLVQDAARVRELEP